MPHTAPGIRLAALDESDLPVLFRWINDRSLVELSSPFKPVSPAAHRDWFERIRQRDDTHIFAIRLDDRAEPIGTCQLLNVDLQRRCAELQIRIGAADARGRGFGTEAVRHLVAFGFQELGLRRITLHVFVTNTAAQRAYEKAGFVREGLLENAAEIDGRSVDAVVMAIQHE